MLLIEGLRSLQRPTYLQTPIGGHHHQLRSLDLVGQLTTPILSILNLLCGQTQYIMTLGNWNGATQLG